MAETGPAKQGTVSGRPGTTGFDVSEQLVALAIDASTDTVPPLDGRLVGVATKPLIAGLAAFDVTAPAIELVETNASVSNTASTATRASVPHLMLALPILHPFRRLLGEGTAN